ncbi:hypothetical protein JAAARDRAFT_125645, partial [Jaapia argillacea MUCL 33604]
AILATAMPTSELEVRQVNQCNVGTLNCCNSVQNYTSEGVQSLAGLLGIVLPDLNALAGIDCSPISVLGVGGGSECAASPVCCENNQFSGLISLGCIPITL